MDWEISGREMEGKQAGGRLSMPEKTQGTGQTFEEVAQSDPKIREIS